MLLIANRLVPVLVAGAMKYYILFEVRLEPSDILETFSINMRHKPLKCICESSKWC
jgi:hypothetical protein